MAKSYKIELAELPAVVEAEPEGERRYMVRLSVKGRLSRVRIGYLTGARNQWLAEPFGRREPIHANSAKAACLALATWAQSQSGVAPFLQSRRAPCDEVL